MIAFITSSPFLPEACALNPANGFTEELRRALPGESRALFVCSDPEDAAFTDRIAGDMEMALTGAGFRFSAFDVLDGRNPGDARALTAAADLIVLAGGHVPTQNAFLRRVNLRDCLRGFEGAVLGISAGSMNRPFDCMTPVSV